MKSRKRASLLFLSRFYSVAHVCFAGNAVQQLLSKHIDLIGGHYVDGGCVGRSAINGEPFSAILTGIGIVSLAGIVVNNNIVLIDTFNYVRASHQSCPSTVLLSVPRPSVCGRSCSQLPLRFLDYCL